MPNCFWLKTFHCFRQPCFLFVHPFSHFIFSFIFLCLYYTDPFKIPSIIVTWEFYQISRQTKKFKKTMKSLKNFWKQSMFSKLFWLSLNSFNLMEWRDTFQMIQKHPTQCRIFLKNKGTVRTIWKFCSQSGNFQDTLGTFQTIWNFLDNQ